MNAPLLASRKTLSPQRPPKTSLWQAIASMGQPLRFFCEQARRHPDAFYSSLGAFAAHVVHGPDLIRKVLTTHARNYVKFEKYRYLRLIGGNGLVTNEGESWLKQRKLVQPAFGRACLENAGKIMVNEAYAAIERVQAQCARDGCILDINETMGEIAVNIAAKSLFSSDVSADVPQIRRELDRSQQLGNVLLRIPLPLYRAVPYLPVFRQICQSAKRLRAIVWELIHARRQSQQVQGDLLDALMAAHDDASQTQMTDEQLQDEVLTLLLAGHETSLLGLTWAFELVARHPDIQAGMREEARSVMHRGFLWSDLDKLPWCKAVVHETLRLFPPAYVIGRSALADDRLGAFDVRAGENVLVNIYGLHRHPDYWTSPDDFNPARMLNPQATDPSRCTYLPFGAGPRACIGSRFALVELIVVLAAFVDRFEISPTRAPAQPSPQITLKTAKAVRLCLKPLHPKQG